MSRNLTAMYAERKSLQWASFVKVCHLLMWTLLQSHSAVCNYCVLGCHWFTGSVFSTQYITAACMFRFYLCYAQYTTTQTYTYCNAHLCLQCASTMPTTVAKRWLLTTASNVPRTPKVPKWRTSTTGSRGTSPLALAVRPAPRTVPLPIAWVGFAVAGVAFVWVYTCTWL